MIERCPHCDAEVRLQIDLLADGRHSAYVRCPQCRARGPEFDDRMMSQKDAERSAIQFWNKRHGRQVVEYVAEDRVREDERRKVVQIIRAIPCKLWAKQWSLENNSRDTYRFANYMRSRLVEVFRGEAQPLASGPAYGGPEKRYWLFAGHKDQALQQYGYMTIVSSYDELRHAQERLSWSIGRGLRDDRGGIYDWWQLFDADACVVVDQEGMDLEEDIPPDA